MSCYFVSIGTCKGLKARPSSCVSVVSLMFVILLIRILCSPFSALVRCRRASSWLTWHSGLPTLLTNRTVFLVLTRQGAFTIVVTTDRPLFSKCLRVTFGLTAANGQVIGRVSMSLVPIRLCSTPKNDDLAGPRPLFSRLVPSSGLRKAMNLVHWSTVRRSVATLSQLTNGPGPVCSVLKLTLLSSCGALQLLCR